MAQENATEGHPTLDLTTDTNLEEPDMEQIRQERFNRNRTMMRNIDAHVSDKILPNKNTTNKEVDAAIKIQSYYRGYIGRKIYVDLLYEQYEKEYDLQREKIMQQMEEGDLLVENHRLEVEYEDNMTTRKNKLRQMEASSITIQRAWRKYLEKKASVANKLPPNIQISDAAVDTESISGTQPMSISTSIDSLKNARSDEDILSDVEFSTKDSLQSSYHDDAAQGSRPTNKNILLENVDTDPESVVSDYSEMADAIKEHLANVQIIKQEDLDSGNALPNEFLVGRKILPRLPEETDAEYAKRLRKLNFLSLAQEFAELKKIDSDALPFGAHKAAVQLHSPMSESTTSETSDSGTATTPVEVTKNFSSDNPSGQHSSKYIPEVSKGANNPEVREAWKESSDEFNKTEKSLFEATNSNGHDNVHDSNKLIEKPDIGKSFINSQTNNVNSSLIKPYSDNSSNKLNSASVEKDEPDSESSSVQPAIKVDGDCFEKQHAALAPHYYHSSKQNNKLNPDIANTSHESASVTTISSNRLRTLSGSNGHGDGDFDVYNMESTLPTMDWEKLEHELQRAAEEERQKKIKR